MRFTLHKIILTAGIAACFALNAQDTGPDWGNPYDLYIGGVTYNGSGYTGHVGLHGSTVTGPDLNTCLDRLNDKKSMHNAAGDTFVSEVWCYLKTTVVYQPMLLEPDLGGDGNTGTTPIHTELDALKEKYRLDLYQQEIDTLKKKYNINGFRSEFEQLYIKSITPQEVEVKR